MTFHLCYRLIPACQRFAPMYRRKRRRKVLHEPQITLIHHQVPSFRGTEVSIPSQSAHGSTPRQLCGIGFSSAACAGESVSTSARLLHPIRVKRLITAIAVTIAFSPSIPSFYSRPLRTLPRIAFTLDFVLSMPACALLMRGWAAWVVGLLFCC